MEGSMRRKVSDDASSSRSADPKAEFKPSPKDKMRNRPENDLIDSNRTTDEPTFTKSGVPGETECLGKAQMRQVTQMRIYY
ncbi:unnamed protein product [Soboliphyme baturini]|uniref:Uncharacterized protein n=1 Tax=Soboliphyme baturini TaxID=241478 RepID=A0A183IS43_9BILA|nr:unnamed protein product [Soboliphyme baturini]